MKISLPFRGVRRLSTTPTMIMVGGGGLINVGEVILMFLLCVKNFLHGISEIDKTTFQRSRPILSFIIIIGYELLLLITDVDCGVRNREGGGGAGKNEGKKTKKRRNWPTDRSSDFHLPPTPPGLGGAPYPNPLLPYQKPTTHPPRRRMFSTLFWTVIPLSSVCITKLWKKGWVPEYLSNLYSFKDSPKKVLIYESISL